MATYQDLVIEANYRPTLPPSGWTKVLRALEVRPPGDGEFPFAATARELTALTSGTRRVRVVALATMPDLGTLDYHKGDTHLELVASDNGPRSKALRLTGKNRQSRVDALRRQIAKATAELRAMGEAP